MNPNYRELRAAGFAPIQRPSAVARLEAHGIGIERDVDAPTVSPGPRMPNEPLKVGTLWAPRWAVAICVAEPCGDEAKDQALARALLDPEFRAAVDTLVVLGTPRALAAFLVSTWEPL